MGSEFLVYLQLGFEHISDVNGYDHILFIIALCAVYLLKDWKELLWMVTAFTIGHSITLALATLDLITLDSNLVEFLIPCTILIASLIDIADRRVGRKDRFRYYKYGLALAFGLIHGMGFSNFLRTVIGGEESILLPLFAFNMGLELGQLLIVFVVLVTSHLVVTVMRMDRREWALILSGATAGIALTMIVDKLAT